jgi:hypothetical protein
VVHHCNKALCLDKAFTPSRRSVSAVNSTSGAAFEAKGLGSKAAVETLHCVAASVTSDGASNLPANATIRAS